MPELLDPIESFLRIAVLFDYAITAIGLFFFVLMVGARDV